MRSRLLGVGGVGVGREGTVCAFVFQAFLCPCAPPGFLFTCFVDCVVRLCLSQEPYAGVNQPDWKTPLLPETKNFEKKEINRKTERKTLFGSETGVSFSRSSHPLHITPEIKKQMSKKTRIKKKKKKVQEEIVRDFVFLKEGGIENLLVVLNKTAHAHILIDSSAFCEYVVH